MTPTVPEGRPPARPRVHVACLADLRNFGDLLFPLVAAHRLGPAGFDVVAASPSGRATGWADVAPSVPMGALIAGREATCGILVGGGNIVCDFSAAAFGNYTGAADAESPLGEAGLTVLWLGAALAGALRGAPVLWNAPGVFRPFAGAGFRDLSDAALRAAEYIAVRDEDSRRFLGPRHGAPVAVTPDTALDLSRMWPAPTLRAAFRRLAERKGVAVDRPVLAVHLRSAAAEEGVHEAMAARIGAFAGAHGLLPLLLAIGPAAGDDVAARRTARHLAVPHLLLDDPAGPREIAAALAAADLYVGASLHGYVACASYGVPGVLVGRPTSRRLKGFLAHLGRPEDLAHGWDEAFAHAAGRLGPAPRRAPPAPPAAWEALDLHWERVLAGLRRPADRSLARLRLLEAFVRVGCAAGGAAWACLPLQPAQRVPAFR